MWRKSLLLLLVESVSYCLSRWRERQSLKTSSDQRAQTSAPKVMWPSLQVTDQRWSDSEIEHCEVLVRKTEKEIQSLNGDNEDYHPFGTPPASSGVHQHIRD
jgi:hypothetical protein